MDLGRFIEHEGRPAVRFERVYDHPVERVWAAVTEPAELAHWFPSRARIELRPGGLADFSGDPNVPSFTGRVVVCEPPHRLGYTWGADELLFELEAVDGGRCRLVLTNFLDAENAAARNAAGWSVCLRELDKLLAGDQADGPHSETAESWHGYYENYVAAGLPYGADVPGAGQR